MIGQLNVVTKAWTPDANTKHRNPFSTLGGLRDHIVGLITACIPPEVTATVQVSSGGTTVGETVPECDPAWVCPSCSTAVALADVLMTRKTLTCPQCQVLFTLKEEPIVFTSTGTVVDGVRPVVLTTDIMVNGRKHTIAGEVLTYEKAVELANSHWGPNVLHTVVYWVPPSSDTPRQGALTPGKCVKAEPGMRVTAVVVSMP